MEYLRAPNFAPERITVFQINPSNPTPFSQQVVPQADNMPGRTQQLWFFDEEWDACCDRELHVPYSYYTVLKVRVCVCACDSTLCVYVCLCVRV